jgi:hypothetical protein
MLEAGQNEDYLTNNRCSTCLKFSGLEHFVDWLHWGPNT